MTNDEKRIEQQTLNYDGVEHVTHRILSDQTEERHMRWSFVLTEQTVEITSHEPARDFMKLYQVLLDKAPPVGILRIDNATDRPYIGQGLKRSKFVGVFAGGYLSAPTHLWTNEDGEPIVRFLDDTMSERLVPVQCKVRWHTAEESLYIENASSFPKVDSGTPATVNSEPTQERKLVDVVPGKLFRSFRVVDKTYDFTTNQAIIVQVLWEAWIDGVPEVPDTILTKATESRADEPRVRDAFRSKGRMHPAWNELIISTRKGMRRLNIPDDAAYNSRQVDNDSASA